jgi:hypothetical protein
MFIGPKGSAEKAGTSIPYDNTVAKMMRARICRKYSRNKQHLMSQANTNRERVWAGFTPYQHNAT